MDQSSVTFPQQIVEAKDGKEAVTAVRVPLTRNVILIKFLAEDVLHYDWKRGKKGWLLLGAGVDPTNKYITHRTVQYQ